MSTPVGLDLDLVQWSHPHPWRATDGGIDVHAGGVLRTVMAGPDGGAGRGTGCILAVVPRGRVRAPPRP